MSSDKELAEATNIGGQGLEIELQQGEQTTSLPVLSETLRSKIIYLFSGTVLLAVWWLVYSHLLPFSRLITYHLLPLREGTHLGSTVEFFIFEVPKVMLLLTLIVFGVGIIRSYFTPDRTRKILAGSRESAGHVFAAFLG